MTTTKRKSPAANADQGAMKPPTPKSFAEQFRDWKCDEGRRIDDGPTPRQTAFREIFGRDPSSLGKAADLLGADPQFEKLSEELRTAAFEAFIEPYVSPRPPKGGKTGRRKGSILEVDRKRTKEAMLRADLAALAGAIRGGPVPSYLYVPHLSREQMLRLDLSAVVSWARRARAKEKEARQERMPGDHVTDARRWAVKAYLRATHAEDSPKIVEALLRRWDSASSRLECLPLPKRLK